jgi:hypothetical protein
MDLPNGQTGLFFSQTSQQHVVRGSPVKLVIHNHIFQSLLTNSFVSLVSGAIQILIIASLQSGPASLPCTFVLPVSYNPDSLSAHPDFLPPLNSADPVPWSSPGINPSLFLPNSLLAHVSTIARPDACISCHTGLSLTKNNPSLIS